MLVRTELDQPVEDNRRCGVLLIETVEKSARGGEMQERKPVIEESAGAAVVALLCGEALRKIPSRSCTGGYFAWGIIKSKAK